ncbi:regulator of microtubule dynamics protein 1 isoform X2 [Bombina bombina]|uniref:regulator of microtubule dynamics protein 1 isoform X2 n=1 Tax=Bombina bombina TaxID=8345 RepID=UPI00235B179D|nr:regulator of microtubule dynamics protein 1 isoform X2 [Bombina bombina]
MFRRVVHRFASSLHPQHGASSARTAASNIPVVLSAKVCQRYTLLERGLVLSSLSYVAFESYRWISKRVTVHASIKVDDIVEQADYLHGSGETEKLYEFLSQYKNSEDDELLWRFARAARDMSQLSKITPDEKKRLIYESFEYVKKALEKNESNSAAHKWYAICLSDVGDYEGIKVKVGNAYIIREHFQRAIELNPKDATAIHLIGLWCYSFADLPWYQTKIASALFATPPSSTFEEALIYFEMAEEGDILQGLPLFCNNSSGEVSVRVGEKNHI